MAIITIIVFILILSVLVIIHELGHFLAAKYFGMGVSEFGIGMPPKLCQLGHWWNTDFVLNALPLGGYCSLIGQEAEPQKPTACQKDVPAFYCFKTWQRFVVILAGPVMNLLLACLIFMLVFCQLGIPQSDEGSVYIQALEPGSPAEQAQLMVESKITLITAENNEQFTPQNIAATIEFINQHQGEHLKLTLIGACQGGKCTSTPKEYYVYVRTMQQRPPDSGALGVILSNIQFYHLPWWQHLPKSIYYGSKQALFLSTSMLGEIGRTIGKLFHKQSHSQLAIMGPVGIVSELTRQQTFATGFLAIIQFTALLSLNLGLINLLPIPAVDGGHLLLIILEKICGRSRIAKIESGINYAGIVFLIILTILITGNDIWRIFS